MVDVAVVVLGCCIGGRHRRRSGKGNLVLSSLVCFSHSQQSLELFWAREYPSEQELEMLLLIMG